jgi:LmbE family N-acetylglucosaminyl deacetylase
MPSQNRRHFIKKTLIGLPLVSTAFATKPMSQVLPSGEKLKIVCVGGHPDDPESGCGGTLILLSKAGHEVTSIYLTAGEAGIEGKSHAEAAIIRKSEAQNACNIMQVKPIFAGQIDGSTVANNEWVEILQKLIENQKPDIVFAHWPIDTHIDHQIASLLTQQVWLRMGQSFALYFYEVCTGEQTLGFKPTDYMDITAVQSQKREAIFCHVSQNPLGIYACGHTDSELFRGREIGVKAAEGFVRMGGKKVNVFSH